MKLPAQLQSQPLPLKQPSKGLSLPHTPLFASKPQTADQVQFGEAVRPESGDNKLVIGWAAKAGLVLFVPTGVFIVIALERERIMSGIKQLKQKIWG